ncbi:transposase [Candidatus Uabimicrobium amorphum]|uniref:Transposase n=1 Tax=Uabimicrobium amorphum TaxID=2596890 RepID=A0A5S9IQR2_UABAM|nr:transposase [Candidatus Uabimicrobium amorphum]BBM86339.1 transposase [Candidatus Uabimicrobium amorphum]
MRPIRISMINGLFHITTRCDNKNFYFREDEDFIEYLKVVEKARQKYGFKLHAYCITSNHVHLLISTPAEDNLSKLMQYINGQYSKNYNRRHKRTGHFWGERFYSTIIESENQLLNTIFYIELNTPPQ